MARASGFTEKATCTTRTCELAMSHRSLRWSNQPRESWTRMDVDDGEHDEQDETDQHEELRRVSAARQPTELESRSIFSTNHAVFAPWCEVCVKAKGTRAKHMRQTIKELAKQEQDGPRIYSDFFYMSEAGVATPMLALKFSRSGME